MFGNCEKMVVISSTTNEWPQVVDVQKGNSLMASTIGSNTKLMEKPSQEILSQQQQQHQQPLKCPRCDSSNTKFCYYNNYSLSQPRHFCKACKRYWTRGGTLRNVPVGGGCRKNKRVKRPNNSTGTSAEGSVANPNLGSSNPPQINNISLASLNHHHINTNPLFYGLPTSHHPSEMNNNSLPFATSELNNALGGLGFSSDHVITSSTTPLLSSYSIFGPSNTNTTTTTTTPSIASLLASGLNQQKFSNTSGLMPFEGMQQLVNENAMKEVKIEQGQTRLGWNNVPCQNQIEQIGFSLSDPSSSSSSLYWNANTSVGGLEHGMIQQILGSQSLP